MKMFAALFAAVAFLLTLGMASAEENTNTPLQQGEARPLIISKAEDSNKKDKKTKKEKKREKKKKKREKKKKKKKAQKNEGN